MSYEDSRERRFSRAEAALEEYFSRVESGEALAIEGWVEQHADIALELRQLHDECLRLDQERTVLPDRTGSQAGVAQSASRDFLDQLARRPNRYGDYELQGEIGRGGMGEVIAAFDRVLRRNLALKIAQTRRSSISGRDEPANPGRLMRFMEEAQITGQLDHPGIIPVHEIGVDPTGRAYFTMKRVEGRDLRKILELVQARDPEWTEARVLGVLLRVCETMAFAHEKGVLHRDLKPANVMVGRFGEVYVMDWGLARVLGAPEVHADTQPGERSPSSRSVQTERRRAQDESPDASVATKDGSVLGTPSYMPLEQAMGKLETLGPGCDIYSVGAMLYELVGNEAPYSPRGTRAAPHVVLSRVLQGPPTSLQGLAPRAPAELVALIEKAMARDISRRYATMKELGSDLRAFLEGRVVQAYESGSWAESKKWVRRNKSLAGAIAGVVLSLAVTIVVISSNAREIEAKNVDLARAKQTAEDNAKVATDKSNDFLSLAAQHELDDLVAQAGQLWPAHPEAIPRLDVWLERARKLMDGQILDPAKGVRMRSNAEHKSMLETLRGRADPQSAESLKADRESHPNHAELLAMQAESTWHSRMLELEPWPNEQDVELQLAFEKLPSDANAMNDLAWSLIDPQSPRYGDEVRGLMLARRAVALANELERGPIRDTLAWACFRRGLFDEALAQERRALVEVDPSRRGEFEESVANLEKAVDSWRGENLAARRRDRETLIARVADLDRAVSVRRTFEFTDAQDRWWHLQLSRLVSARESLLDPDRGLLGDTLAEPFGWGITKRHEFARTIRERSITCLESKARWDDALRAIAASPGYHGLKIVPQLGLVPIGVDPDSGLWEFAHLQTGEPALRGADGRLALTEESGLVFVLIPGGSFLMGAQPAVEHGQNHDPQAAVGESPVTGLTLSAFLLSKYEMTQAQWIRLMAANPSKRKPGYYPTGISGNLLHPVENVSWDACAELCRRMDLTLPTEAQWEYAARAGTSTPWWTGEEKESLRGALNIADRTAAELARWPECADWPDLDDGAVFHTDVGGYRGNSFGLHDTAGNVREWCADWFGNYSTAARPGDGLRESGLRDGRVHRGGDFGDTAAIVRSSARARDLPSFSSMQIGLRPARALHATSDH